MLEGAYERIIIGDCYGDIELGLFVIRGENVVLLGRLVRCPLLLTATCPHTHSAVTLAPRLLSYSLLSELAGPSGEVRVRPRG